MLDQYEIVRENMNQVAYEVEPDPLMLFKNLKGIRNGFLLESADRCGEIGRFSLIGIQPVLELRSNGGTVNLSRIHQDKSEEIKLDMNPFDLMKSLLNSADQPFKDLPFSNGGLAGWVGYDAVRHVETISDTIQTKPEMDDIHLMLPRHLIVIDRELQVIQMLTFGLKINNVPDHDNYEEHRYTIDKVQNFIKNQKLLIEKSAAEGNPVSEESSNKKTSAVSNMSPLDLAKDWYSDTSKEKYFENVYTAKDHIKKGDAFQLVFSRRLSKKTELTAIQLYKQLRELNPSPYMFIVSTEEVDVVGASPETMVNMKNQKAIIHPIAGTRPRGRTEIEDQNYELELLKDVKENAEHLMLVDLARNDIGRISEYGSVEIPKFRTIERFSHVMHIVSEVVGGVRKEMHAVDVFKACFPAGTVSGAPKIRAMSIIDENENVRRGVYAGAVGWFGTNNEMDTCIAIRTAVIKDGVVSVQAGGGLVQDSDPELEFMETLHKSASVMRAVQMGESLHCNQFNG